MFALKFFKSTLSYIGPIYTVFFSGSNNLFAQKFYRDFGNVISVLEEEQEAVKDRSIFLHIKIQYLYKYIKKKIFNDFILTLKEAVGKGQVNF